MKEALYVLTWNKIQDSLLNKKMRLRTVSNVCYHLCLKRRGIGEYMYIHVLACAQNISGKIPKDVRMVITEEEKSRRLALKHLFLKL